MRKAWMALALAAALPLAAEARPAPLSPKTSPLAEEVRALQIYDTNGNPKAALEHIDEVLARARKDPRIDPDDMAYALAARASALSSLDRSEESLALFRQIEAGLAARDAGPSERRAGLLQGISGELAALGKLDEATDYGNRALAMAEAVAGRASPEYGDALYNLGLIDFQRGRQQDAIPKCEQALAIARAYALKTGERVQEPSVIGISLAALQLYTSDAETAVITARDAATWAEDHLPEDHRVRVQAVHQYGAILSEAGLYGQSIPILRRTLEQRRRILSSDDPQLALSLHALAYALDNAGNKTEAKPLYERAVAIFEQHPDKLNAKGLSTMIGQLARIARWEGDEDKALALRHKALAVAHQYTTSPDDQVVLSAEYNLARQLFDDQRIAEAEPLIAHALDGFTRGNSPTNKKRITAISLAAQLEAWHGDRAGALDRLQSALSPLRSRLLDRATSRKDVMTLAEEFRDAFMELARIAIVNKADATTFDALQMSNLGDLQGAFSSLAVVQDNYGPEARQAIRDYLARAASSRQLRKALDQALVAGDAARTVALQSQVADADAALREADARVAALVPGYSALTAVEPAQLAEARRRLKSGEGLALIGADGAGLVTMIVTRDRIAIGESRVASRHLLELQQRLRASVESALLDGGTGRYDRAAAYELYGLIFPRTVRAALGSVRELEILAPGPLSTLPFAALVTRPPKGSDADPAALRKTAWLVRDHAVSVMISARPLPRRPARAESRLTFAGIGAPVLGAPATLAMRSAPQLAAGDTSFASLSQLASLPDAERELRSMAGYFRGGTQLLVGPGATESAVKRAPLDQARVVAFATHGLVEGALRGVIEPALVMTPPSVPTPFDDGLLTASEVAQLRLDADWVILSACDTSAGDSENAPTYSGLARAFISAGSRALLLSHWPVRDDVASRLTLLTVDGARKGRSRAEALRRAQLEILGDTSVAGGAHPASWAPFVLVGD